MKHKMGSAIPAGEETHRSTEGRPGMVSVVQTAGDLANFDTCTLIILSEKFHAN